MQRVEDWRPTKFEHDADGVRGSRDPDELAAGSRLTADLVCAFYSSAIPRHASGALVDLGCGKAPLYGFYRRHVDQVTLVDWAQSLHANPHLDVVQDLNEPLQLPAAGFDTVLLSDVLEHIRLPGDLLAEIARILRPGGRLLMNVPFLYGLHEQPHDYYRYTRFALEYLVANAGLDVVEMHALGGYPEVVADLTSKVAGRVPRVGPRLASGVHRSARGLLRRGYGRRLSDRTREQWPLGYALVAVKPGPPQ